ncbi:MAG: acyltransferase [Bacteroidia bacterium]|nr:acyltransferase [Bacteroidia bacterium]
MVFFFHYYILSGGEPPWLPKLAGFGWTGVDLFFVLSGFLISQQLFAQIKQGQTVSLKQFFTKRFFRIIPAFAVTLALYFFWPYFREKESLPPLWKFLSFTQNLGLNIKDFGTFSHAWSLCVEEHFYLLLPLLLIALQRTNYMHRAVWLLLMLVAFGFFIRYYSFTRLYVPKMEEENGWLNWYKFIYYPTYNRLDGLLAGVGIAAIYQFKPLLWNRLSKFGNLFVVLGLILLTGAYFLCEDQQSFGASVFGFSMVAMGYACLVVVAISPTCFLFRWNSKISSGIATLSYAIYLTHKGVIHITHELLSNNNISENGRLVICVFTCMAAALLLHLAVEKPFMKIRNRLLN